MADGLAAMANTHTGVVLLGVDDKSPEYLLLDDAELKLTIFAAKPPHGEDR